MSKTAPTPEPRKGMPSPKLLKAEFTARFLSRFNDPAFDDLRPELDRIAAVAWDGYREGRKSPVTRKAGPGYADPDYELSVDWTSHEALDRDRAVQEEVRNAARTLLEAVKAQREGRLACAGSDLEGPRQK